MKIVHRLQFRATLATVLSTSQNPHGFHISGFSKIDTARRRERTSWWTSSGPRLAQTKCKFKISKWIFQRKGCRKNRTRQRTPPIYTGCFFITVTTPWCGHAVWGTSTNQNLQTQPQTRGKKIVNHIHKLLWFWRILDKGTVEKQRHATNHANQNPSNTKRLASGWKID